MTPEQTRKLARPTRRNAVLLQVAVISALAMVSAGLALLAHTGRSSPQFAAREGNVPADTARTTAARLAAGEPVLRDLRPMQPIDPHRHGRAARLASSQPQTMR